MSDATTRGPWRLHDMERATIVAGKPGREVANCLNGFGDQDANARLIAKTPAMRDALAIIADWRKVRAQLNWEHPKAVMDALDSILDLARRTIEEEDEA